MNALQRGPAREKEGGSLLLTLTPAPASRYWKNTRKRFGGKNNLSVLSMEVPQKTKNRVAIRSSSPTPGHISRQNYNSKRYMDPYVHSSTIYNSQNTEAS